MVEDHVLTVSEFNEQINLLFGQHFPEVVIVGEISELHTAKKDSLLYITLKDEKAELKVFAFADQIINWKQLEEGMTVQVWGRPEIFKRRGQFNLHAHDILPVGEGALRLAFEKLRQRLESEGLFALERKRPLPFFPETIALLTAPKSRAYSDFIKVLAERIGGLKIVFFPVQVQGLEAPRQIVAALSWLASERAEIDLVVITRGGGSLEDLAAFNTEEVVRAVYRCPFPVVSAVGHEADISLVDLVADLRASTPSNAAELIVPHREELRQNIDHWHNHIWQNLRLKIVSLVGKINEVVLVIERYFQTQRLMVATIEARIKRAGVRVNRRTAACLAETQLWWQTIDRRFGFNLAWAKGEIDNRWRLLQGLNPEAILARGYSVTRLTDGRLVKNVTDVKVGEKMVTRISRGKIDSVVEAVREDTDG